MGPGLGGASGWSVTGMAPRRCYAVSTWRKSLVRSRLNLHVRRARASPRNRDSKIMLHVEGAANQLVNRACNIVTPETRKRGGGLGEGGADPYPWV